MRLSLAVIDIEGRKRPADPAKVDSLAASMAVEGLLQPIGVIRTDRIDANEDTIYKLCYGLHRYVAAGQLGWDDIEVVAHSAGDLASKAKARAILAGAGDDEAAQITPELLGELAEIDENLIRHELSRSQFDSQNKRRKAIYEKLYPETTRQASSIKANDIKRGLADSANPDNQDKQTPKNYVADTAEKTGKSEATIRESLARAEVPNIETAPEDAPVVELNKVASLHGKGVRKAKEADKLRKEAEAAKLEETKQRKAEEAAKLEEEAEKAKADAQAKLEAIKAPSPTKKKEKRTGKVAKTSGVLQIEGGTKAGEPLDAPKEVDRAGRENTIKGIGYILDSMKEALPSLTNDALDLFMVTVVRANRELAQLDRV